jgi:DNA-directed RNA polymerase alpha subunit
MSAQAISLLLDRYHRKLGSMDKLIELVSLSCRAANALGRHGVTSRKQAKERRITELLRHEKNCGRRTIEEIERWMAEE